MRILRRAVWLAYISLRDPELFYHLMTATRGPDVKWQWLKHCFTAWIRWRIFPVSPYWPDLRKGRILTGDFFRIVGELRVIKSSADSSVLVSLEHYLGHVKHGLRSMRRVPWLSGEERGELEVLLNLALILEGFGNFSGEGIEQVVWQWWEKQHLPLFEEGN
jgi:hypothetical protein